MGLVDSIIKKKDQRDRVKRSREARDFSGKYICGWYLVGMSALISIIAFSSNSKNSLIWGILLLIPAILGVLIVVKARKKKNSWIEYESLINKNGNTSLRMISTSVNKPISQVCIELQEMIEKELFVGEKGDRNAYIDKENELLVMVRDESPIQSINESIAKIKDKMRFINDSENVAAIRNAEQNIHDDRMSECLKSLENSVRVIEIKVSKNPELKRKRDIVRLEEFYLPQIIRLINTYISPDSSISTKKKIADALHVSERALNNIRQMVSEEDDFDVDVESQILKTTLMRDGLLGSDFDIK